MTIKSILVPFSGNDEEISAMDAAFTLAHGFRADVKVLHIAPDPREIMAATYAGLGVPPPSFGNLMEEIEIANNKKKEESRKKYDKIRQKNSIKYDSDSLSPDHASSSFHYEIGAAEGIIAGKGRISDLIIMGRTIRNTSSHYASAMISAPFRCGRPVLFTPPGSLSGEIGAKIMIAWNGSVESSRAVFSAMPLLARSRKVWVITENNEYAENGPSVQDLALYLKLHNIEAEAIISSTKNYSAGAALIRDAKEHGADMLVMGSFTHSRFREMLLGGVTTFMMEHSELPVLMIH